ncbi:DUF5675 family protein [Larkinella sp. VNQ87]|uniref:DUF5675 family protein n=1 Tax=Larkinella sp. VNQ87 TaxID=3400921 RepID=UPI003C128C55
MNLSLIRKDFSDQSTLGALSIDGHFFCFVLEDRERGLHSAMSHSELLANKVFGKTAIPTGRYEIILSFSERFQKQLPLLLNVPGFEGIRIHSGNVAAHTEGCLLVGSGILPNRVGNSRATLNSLMKLLNKTAKKEKIFIEISGHRPVMPDLVPEPHRIPHRNHLVSTSNLLK